MTTRKEVEIEINVWDFIDIDKLNEYVDDFTGEILPNLEYAFDKIQENGMARLIINSEE